MSLRYPRLDYFWFTLLHELAHLVLHNEQLKEPVFFDVEATEKDRLRRPPIALRRTPSSTASLGAIARLNTTRATEPCTHTLLSRASIRASSPDSSEGIRQLQALQPDHQRARRSRHYLPAMIRYVPFLKAKRGELTAMSELTPEVKSAICPCFDFPRKKRSTTPRRTRIRQIASPKVKGTGARTQSFTSTTATSRRN